MQQLYFILVVCLVDTCLWDDFASKDLSSGQICQLIHSGKPSLYCLK